MSWRTMLEFNHDKMPETDAELFAWAKQMRTFIRCGEYRDLPNGVTFFGMRHHSDECPLGEPPHGWDNEKP